jgi:hypothetical protein
MGPRRVDPGKLGESFGKSPGIARALGAKKPVLGLDKKRNGIYTVHTVYIQ